MFLQHLISPKLEERGFLKFSKRDDDKRNTYVELTEAGTELIIEMNKTTIIRIIPYWKDH